MRRALAAFAAPAPRGRIRKRAEALNPHGRSAARAATKQRLRLRDVRTVKAHAVQVAAHEYKDAEYAKVHHLVDMFVDHDGKFWGTPTGATPQHVALNADAMSRIAYRLAPDTWRRYGSPMRRFLSFYMMERAAMGATGALYPAPPSVVRAFLEEIAQASDTVSPVVSAASAILFAHRLNQASSGDIAEVCRLATVAARREKGRARRQRAPIEAYQVEEIMLAWGLSTDRRERATALYVALGFACHLRHADLARLRIGGIAEAGTKGEHLMLFLPEGKNDTSFNGDWIALPARKGDAEGTKLCPVWLLLRYLEDFGGDDASLLFGDFVNAPGGDASAFKAAAPVKPATAIAWIRAALETCCGLESDYAQQYACHSLRRGARHHAALLHLPGWVDRRLGRWRSKAGSDTYTSTELHLVMLAAQSLWDTQMPL